MKQYDFKERNDLSKIGISKVVNYLYSLKETVYVDNVEDDREFQEFDIDLIHSTHNNVFNIEVKADTYDSGNFFFETVSNATKGTLGCFMYTCADYVHYYFTKYNTLYVLPMPATRDWFNINKFRFKEKKLATKNGNKLLYYSYGYAVPIRIVMNEVDGVIERRLD